MGTKEKREEIWITWKKTLLGVIPAILLGGLLGPWIEDRLFSPWVVAIVLILGGLLLIAIEKKPRNPRYHSLADVPWHIILGIGLMQCLAMIPGTSRSAATIMGALIMGVSRTVAVEFSFFLALPTMAAATTYSLIKNGSTLHGSDVMVLVTGFLIAFFVVLTVINFFLHYVKRHDFRFFGWYRIVLGLLVMMYFLTR
jgi:undecaprenyl-diphosphatase